MNLPSGAAEKSAKHGAEDKTMSIKQAMSSLMIKRTSAMPDLFDLVGEVFKVLELRHKQNLSQAQKSILDGTSQWEAKIAITGKAWFISLNKITNCKPHLGIIVHETVLGIIYH